MCIIRKSAHKIKGIFKKCKDVQSVIFEKFQFGEHRQIGTPRIIENNVILLGRLVSTTFVNNIFFLIIDLQGSYKNGCMETVGTAICTTSSNTKDNL